MSAGHHKKQTHVSIWGKKNYYEFYHVMNIIALTFFFHICESRFLLSEFDLSYHRDASRQEIKNRLVE